MRNTWEDKNAKEVRASIDEWREQEKKTGYFEQKAEDDPRFYASSAFYFIRGTRRHLRRLLRKRFGVKVRYFGFRSKQYIASRRRFPYYRPRTPQDYYDYVQFSVMSNLLRVLDVLWFAMHSAYIRAHHAGEDPDAAACAALFSCLRMGPWAATPTSQEEPDDTLREMSAKGVAGFVGAHIRRAENRRHEAGLRESGGNFLQELLPATLIAWSERQSGEPLHPGSGTTNLVSRAQRQLEKLGSEAAEKGTVHEELDELTGPGQGDRLLEEFELRETMHQQNQQLDILEQTARLSKREAEVWKRHRRGMEDAEIAAELEITADNVYVVKHNAIKKLTEARKVSGF